MNNRREFIRTMALLSSGAFIMYHFPGCSFKKKQIGIQLYTLRNSIPDNLLGTLTKLSEIGYNNIEAYGFNGEFYNIPAKKFKKTINDLGMELTCTHTDITLENVDKYIEGAEQSGLEYLVLPSMGSRPAKTIDDYKKAARELNKIGEKTRNAEIRFGYHNHVREFESIDNTIPYDILLQETDPDLVTFQLDIYWIIKGGYDPLAYFKNYPGRFELWHVKDMAPSGESTVIGTGTIDYPEIFKHAKESGLKYFYVEQEQYEGSPMECCRESYEYLSEMRKT